MIQNVANGIAMKNKEAKSSPRSEELGFASQTRRIKMLELIPASAIIAIVVIALIVIFLAVGYVKAPPDMAFIISGIKKKSKIVIGKAAIRIPFFERLDKLNLRLIPIDVKTSNAVPTADYININVEATVNVKISNEPEKLRLAAENFLNKNTEYIAGVAREVLEGNVRELSLIHI